MKHHFINFFQSFYSIKPYDKALHGRASARFNLLVLFIILSIIISITTLFIGVYARFHVIQPIMKSFPDIQIVNGYAEMEDPTPMVLEGRTSPVNHYFLAEKEGQDKKDATVTVLIDTQKDGYDPKVFNKPEYHHYTVIIARSVMRFAFFMLIPSALYFIILRHFVYCPMWLYYIIVTVGLVIALLKYEQKRRTESLYAATAGINRDHDHPSI